MKAPLKTILKVVGFIAVGMSFLFIPTILLIGYQKVTEWIFGDWNYIKSPVILLFLAIGFFAIFIWFINKATGD